MILIILCFLLFPPVVMAGEITHEESIAFGSILLYPTGDTIRIDARSGPNTPSADKSGIIGGKSGKITMTATAYEHVDIGYPASVILRNGSEQITVNNIGKYSQYTSTGVDIAANNSVDIHIGGEMILQANEVPGNYTGEMTINVHFE